MVKLRQVKILALLNSSTFNVLILRIPTFADVPNFTFSHPLCWHIYLFVSVLIVFLLKGGFTKNWQHHYSEKELEEISALKCCTMRFISPFLLHCSGQKRSHIANHDYWKRHKERKAKGKTLITPRSYKSAASWLHLRFSARELNETLFTIAKKYAETELTFSAHSFSSFRRRA